MRGIRYTRKIYPTGNGHPRKPQLYPIKSDSFKRGILIPRTRGDYTQYTLQPKSSSIIRHLLYGMGSVINLNARSMSFESAGSCTTEYRRTHTQQSQRTPPDVHTELGELGVCCSAEKYETRYAKKTAFALVLYRSKFSLTLGRARHKSGLIATQGRSFTLRNVAVKRWRVSA